MIMELLHTCRIIINVGRQCTLKNAIIVGHCYYYSMCQGADDFTATEHCDRHANENLSQVKAVLGLLCEGRHCVLGIAVMTASQ